MHIFNATSSVLLQTMLLLVNKNLQHTDNTNVLQSDINNNSTEKYCYNPFGCYEMSYPWADEILRPVSYVPESPEKVNPKYCLYTQHNMDICQNLNIMDTSSLEQSFLMPFHKVYFITHGFIQHGYKKWIKKMTMELLKLSDCSVIVVDWSGGSGPPYPQAVANIRLVGAMTAHLINHIVVQVGTNPELIHFIGHGLGAHMAAYAGQTTQKDFRYKLGRITGLDPAEPHFSKTDPIVRLDPTDADFVDVIHTDAGPFLSGGLGILQPIGHVDFYPNGGTEQPGCHEGVISHIRKGSRNFYRGIRNMISCNHIRSYQYFTESINPGPCYFMGTDCGSWEEFQNGSCFNCSKSNKCPFQTKFGMHADSFLKKGTAYESPLRHSLPRSNIRLFMMTGAEEPFCRHHYYIIWKISDSCKSVQHGGEIGLMWVTIKGEKGITTDIRLTQLEEYYEPGSEHRVTVPGAPVGKLESAVLRWEYRTNPLNPLTWRFITTPRIYISWIKMESIEEGDSLTICPAEDVPLTAWKPLILSKRPGQDNCNITPTYKQRTNCEDSLMTSHN
ncbi:pancreatic lipase-related protein 2-like [Zootermopsis nevadensis]|uniref:Pancreatic lipase-related protein 2 n=1 Tax=Zootermopsis nevadensis TaxID=136037 RepID=A0A067QS20_ZOONE|nr:pancreatic lipase-related protein 2-like [Zootermopsis nevadensis]KDR08050.1 Pancreatic lipase-related protein 2 [Zootermopsis nevadensis]